jgi:hypothetical protein
VPLHLFSCLARLPDERQLRGFGLTADLYPRKVVRGSQVLKKTPCNSPLPHQPGFVSLGSYIHDAR